MRLIINKNFTDIDTQLIEEPSIKLPDRSVSSIDENLKTIICHDATCIPEQYLEKITEVYLYNQTTSRSIMFLYENFFHLVYNDPTTFKDTMKKHLFEVTNYIHLNINVPSVVLPSVTAVKVEQTTDDIEKRINDKFGSFGNDKMFSMLLGMIDPMMGKKRTLND